MSAGPSGVRSIAPGVVVMPGPISAGQGLRIAEACAVGFDPRVAPGFARPVGSVLYSRDGAAAFQKTGPGDTDWGIPGGGATTAPGFPTSFVSLHGVEASRAPLTYGLLYPFGASTSEWVQAYAGSGAPPPTNMLCAYPGVFPRACTIREIIISNTVPVFVPPPGTRLKLGIYANAGDGVPFPGALLATMPAYGSGTYLNGGKTIWPVNLPVPAGSLLWMVETCDGTANFSQAYINQNHASDAAAVLGFTDDIYVPGGQTRLRVWLVYGWECPKVYDDTLPAIFPTVDTVAISDNNLVRSGLPFWAMRLGPP